MHVTQRAGWLTKVWAAPALAGPAGAPLRLLSKLNALRLPMPALALALVALALVALALVALALVALALALAVPWSVRGPKISLPAEAAVAGLRRPLTTSPPSPVLMAITLGLRQGISRLLEPTSCCGSTCS
jgi:hypothetical protein